MDRRLAIRLGIVSGVLALGAAGIWIASRAGTDDAAAEDIVVEAPVAAPEEKPGEMSADLESKTLFSPKNDAFQRVQFSQPAEVQEPSRWDESREVKPINGLRAKFGSSSQTAEPLVPENGRSFDANPTAAEEPTTAETATADPASNGPAGASESQLKSGETDSAPATKGNPWAKIHANAPVNEQPSTADASAQSADQPTAETSTEPVQSDAANAQREGNKAQGGVDSIEQRPSANLSNPAASTWAKDARFLTGQQPASLPAELQESGTVRQLPQSAPATGAAGGFGHKQDQSSITSEGSGRPGAKQLEGVQTPQLTIEKIAPVEVQVGKPAVLQIKIRNTGTVAAHGVEIQDEVPAGTQLLSTTPQATGGLGGKLEWVLGDLAPGAEASVQVEVMPLDEGEIGSVASVLFRADASARTVATRPQLALKVDSPRQVMIGENVTMTITISNPGTGVATGVLVEERVPQGLTHPAGGELEFEVGQLKPGESRQLELTMKAAAPGAVTNLLSARGDANLQAQEQVQLQVVAPDLEVAMSGPSKRYLERQATYTVSVSNPGTAPAKDVQLVTHLPRGLKFVSANNAGHYDSQGHHVTWNLEELPPAETGTVTLTALPIEAGEQKLVTEGKAQQGLMDQLEQTIVVEGLAAIFFEVVDVEDPVEAGGETTYEIRVMNQGSKACTNVVVAVAIPPEMKPVSAEGPVRYEMRGQEIVFEPLPRLPPKADTIFRLRVQGVQPGHHRVSVQVACAEIPERVTKEESTRIYSDE